MPPASGAGGARRVRAIGLVPCPRERESDYVEIGGCVEVGEMEVRRHEALASAPWTLVCAEVRLDRPVNDTVPVRVTCALTASIAGPDARIDALRAASNRTTTASDVGHVRLDGIGVPASLRCRLEGEARSLAVRVPATPRAPFDVAITSIAETVDVPPTSGRQTLRLTVANRLDRSSGAFAVECRVSDLGVTFAGSASSLGPREESGLEVAHDSATALPTGVHPVVCRLVPWARLGTRSSVTAVARGVVRSTR